MKRFTATTILIISLLTTTAYAKDRVSMGYLYDTSISPTEVVEKTNGNINVVSPTWFDLTLDGHLEINNMCDQEFVDEMHRKNILVTPFLSNHWGYKKAKSAFANVETLTDEIVEAINLYNVDGVNIDLENLSPNNKEDLVNFAKVLRDKMPADKTLSIAVAANPHKLTTTWISAYDYASLADHADYLVLMAYDEHSQGGSAGPVASIGFVKKSIDVILENVSRDKVVLGIPLYGRFWKEGEEAGGEAIVISQVERIAKRYKAMPMYDINTATATVKITVKEGEKKAYVNGRYLSEGVYNIWYENEDSILEKLSLMNEYGLKGSALWALDNESEDFWEYYNVGFNDEEYESEITIINRERYKDMEKIRATFNPIKLDFKFPTKTPRHFEKNDEAHMGIQVFELEKYLLPTGEVVIKKKEMKSLMNIKISHANKNHTVPRN